MFWSHVGASVKKLLRRGGTFEEVWSLSLLPASPFPAAYIEQIHKFRRITSSAHDGLDRSVSMRPGLQALTISPG